MTKIQAFCLSGQKLLKTHLCGVWNIYFLLSKVPDENSKINVTPTQTLTERKATQVLALKRAENSSIWLQELSWDYCLVVRATFKPFDLNFLCTVVRTSGQQNSHRTTSTRLKRPIIMIEVKWFFFKTLLYTNFYRIKIFQKSMKFKR